MKILIIEDDAKIASNLKKGLEFKNYVVDVAEDGITGLEMALDDYYQVIILDRMLPSLDGLSVCQKLREKQNFTPILMLTAKTMINDKVEGLEAGADDYLAKPFAFAELLARLKALTRRPKINKQEMLKIVDLELNFDTQEVKRAKQKIDLSRKEYLLLEFLMRNPNRFFSADELVEKVWAYEDNVLANTAQVYLGYLRKKIDQAFQHLPALILTKRGFGYALKVPDEYTK